MHFEDTTPEEEQAINFQEVIRQIEFRSIMMEELGITEPITFFSRTLLQATFPHSYRIDRQGKELTLTNGNLTITMYGRYGLPYGHYALLPGLDHGLGYRCGRPGFRPSAGLLGRFLGQFGAPG